MVFRLVDKLLFGATLLLALQVPQLTDHYRQFLSGQLDTTEWQVNGYDETAKQHGYDSVQAMIDHHLENSVDSVKTDALQKSETIAQLDELQHAITVFQEGNLLQQTAYMVAPSRFSTLQKTLSNFVPGIPLTLEGWLFGVIAGLSLNFLLVMPVWWFARRKKPKIAANPRPTPARIRIEPTVRGRP